LYIFSASDRAFIKNQFRQRLVFSVYLEYHFSVNLKSNALVVFHYFGNPGIYKWLIQFRHGLSVATRAKGSRKNNFTFSAPMHPA